MAKLSGTELKRLHRTWRRKTESRVAILLDGVQSPFNVGSIVRTAAAQRVAHMYLAGGATTPDHAKSAKLSLGTQRYLTWTEHETGELAAQQAQADGYRLVSIELTTQAVAMHEADMAGDVCLVLGHEDRGVSDPVLKASAAVVFAPQLGKVGSLNVATTAAIAIYEARRQGWPDAGGSAQ